MVKEVIIFLMALILISMLIHSHSQSKLTENFEDSINYSANGTITKLYGIQNFKIGDNDKEYLVFNGTSSFLKIPSIDSENFILTFKIKSSKTDCHILSGSSGSFNLKIVNGNLSFSSPLLDGSHSNNINIKLDKPYLVKLGISGDSGYLEIEDNKSVFNLTETLNVGDIYIGKNFSSTNFFKGEIGDIKLIKHDMESVNLLKEKESPKVCNWNPIGKTKSECVDNCELFDGCENTERCKEICNDCDDENKCEWLTNQCNYKLSGKNYTECVYKCIKQNNCNWEICVTKCSTCGLKCPWNEIPEENLNKYYEPPKKGNIGSPGRPRIRVETSTGMVSIYWNAPDSGDAPIETYIYFLYKTFKKNEGVKIGLVPFSKCRNCFHVLDNLDPNETYSVGIRAYNSLGGKGSLSDMSNIETFKPKLERIRNDIGLISLETLSNNDAYMNNYHYCNN